MQGGGGGSVGSAAFQHTTVINAKYGRQNVNRFLHTYTPVLINMYQVKIPYYNKRSMFFHIAEISLACEINRFHFHLKNV